MPPQPLMLPQPRTIIELAARGINGTREASSARHRAARERPAHGIASAVSGLRARCIEWTDIERTVGAASDRARCRARGRGMERATGVIERAVSGPCARGIEWAARSIGRIPTRSRSRGSAMPSAARSKLWMDHSIPLAARSTPHAVHTMPRQQSTQCRGPLAKKAI